jgi:hypothetical protein
VGEGLRPSPIAEGGIVKKYCSDKDMNNEIKLLMRNGWRYLVRKKHGAIVSPDGMKLSVPSTPSDCRALYNFRRDVRHLIEGVR